MSRCAYCGAYIATDQEVQVQAGLEYCMGCPLTPFAYNGVKAAEHGMFLRKLISVPLKDLQSIAKKLSLKLKKNRDPASFWRVLLNSASEAGKFEELRRLVMEIRIGRS